MPTAEQRLALVLEASDKASAILQKVRKEVEAVTGASAAGAKGGKEAADNLNALSNTTPRLKQLGDKLSAVAFSINEARVGGLGTVKVIGSIAENAALSTTAFASWAGPIAGAVALLGTALAIVMDTRKEEERLANFQQHLQGQTLDNLRTIVEQTRQARDHSLKLIEKEDLGMLERAVGYVDLLMGNRGTSQAIRTAAEHGAFKDVKANASENEAAEAALAPRERAERARLQALKDQVDEMIRQRNVMIATTRIQLDQAREVASVGEVERQNAKATLETQNLSVDAMFRHRDEAGKLVALTKEELAEQGRLKDLNEEAYRLSLKTLQLREQQRMQDASLDSQAKILGVRMELDMLAGTSNIFAQQRQAVQLSYERESIGIKRIWGLTDFSITQEVRLVALKMEQLRLLDLIAARTTKQQEADRLASSSNPADAIVGRMRQIEEERKAQAAASDDGGVEAARNAEQKKRELVRQTFTATAGSLKAIEDATANSENSRTKALHHFAKNYRAIIIGAKAAEAAVDSAKAFASIPAHLAVQDYTGALLAGLAGTQLAAAAALGFAEAGGGGSAGSGGGGGAGGGSSDGASTFRPAGATDAVQPLVVNVYTLHPSDPQLVQSIAFELRKGELLKRPDLQTPPAVGIGATVR